MSNITAQDVSNLRQKTGAGMMDCRKALVKSDGNIEKAIEYLRKKGQKIATSRGDRDAKEGVVVTAINDEKTSAVILKLTCETDFVAKNLEFIELAKKFVDLALSSHATNPDALKENQMDEGKKVGVKLLDYMAKIGEKIDIAELIHTESEGIVSYIHGENRIGVVVGVNKAINLDNEEAIRSVAMQVAAMNPLAVDEHSISENMVQKEKDIISDQIKQDPKNAGKPKNIIENITKGKLNAFFKENTLLAQPFVKDNSKPVKDFVASIDKELQIKFFHRVALG